MMSKKLICFMLLAVGQVVFASAEMEEATQAPQKSLVRRIVDTVRPDWLIDWYEKFRGFDEAKRLKSAAERGRTHIVNEILSSDEGKGIDLVDKEKALDLAEQSGHTATAEALKKATTKPQGEAKEKSHATSVPLQSEEQIPLQQEGHVQPSLQQAGASQESKQDHVVPQSEISKVRSLSQDLPTFKEDVSNDHRQNTSQAMADYSRRKHPGFRDWWASGNKREYVHTNKDGTQLLITPEEHSALQQKGLFNTDAVNIKRDGNDLVDKATNQKIDLLQKPKTEQPAPQAAQLVQQPFHGALADSWGTPAPKSQAPPISQESSSASPQLQQEQARVKSAIKSEVDKKLQEKGLKLQVSDDLLNKAIEGKKLAELQTMNKVVTAEKIVDDMIKEDARQKTQEHGFMKYDSKREKELSKELSNAVNSGNIEYAASLIKDGADAKEITNQDFKNDMLNWAIKQNDSYIQREITKAGAKQTTQDELHKQLFTAVEQGNNDEVRQLIKAGADVNASLDANNSKALDVAASRGHADVAKTLIEAGADVNGPGFLTKTPLHRAIEAGHTGVVNLLLEHKDIDVKKPETVNGYTPLHVAAQKGDISTAKKLIEKHKADVNAKDKSNNVPLHSAAYNGHVNIAKILLDHGAKVDLAKSALDKVEQQKGKDSFQNNKKKFQDVIEVHEKKLSELVSKEHLNKQLHEAAAKGDHKKVGELVKAGADVNSKDEKGNTALHTAAKKGDANTVKTLLEKGANKDETNKDFKNAAQLAGLEGHAEAMQKIVSYEQKK